MNTFDLSRLSKDDEERASRLCLFIAGFVRDAPFNMVAHAFVLVLGKHLYKADDRVVAIETAIEWLQILLKKAKAA